MAMQFEFTDQVGQGSAAPSSSAPPVPVPSFAIAGEGEAMRSDNRQPEAIPAPPAPHLEFASEIDSAGTFAEAKAAIPSPAPRVPEAPRSFAPAVAPSSAESPALARPIASTAPAGVVPPPASPGRPGIFAAVGAAGPAPAAQGGVLPKSAAPVAKPAAPGGRPAIFAAAGIPEPATAKSPTAKAAPAPTAPTAEKPAHSPIIAIPPPPQRADAGKPAGGPPAAPGGGGPPAGGHGGGRGPGGHPPGGGGNGGTPPQGDGGGGAAGAAPPGGVRIGDKLVEMGLISKDQLQVALYERRRTNKLIGTLLVELGFITESALSSVLASASGFERFDAAATVVEPELLKRFPKEVAQRYRVFPVSMEGTTLRLAMADIYDVLALDQAHRFVPPGTEIIPLVSAEAEILQTIDQYYGYEFSIDGILRELETGKHDTSAQALSGDGYVHPLVRLVNAILLDAVRSLASDIHFEPEGTFLRLRYRIDGVMQQVRTLQKDLWPAVSHRLKIVSGMNIADKLNPQDGRFGFTYGSHRIDFRVAALPTVNGENIVIRILDKSRAVMNLETLGFSEHNMHLLDRLLLRPEGIIVVTGPTGSGKTTTLYAVLNKVSTLERNIMTLEDPVEYELPLIRQSQVREGTGMNFADGVRAMLRQDPDIIFIGEIRDQATASMALRAAMTGHQVYSTLHTNDAASAIPRLHDLGLEHGLLSGNIIGILAQRLVRKVCGVCGATRPATADECRIFGVDPANPPTVAQAVGCEDCRFTGYKGRVAVHEILPINAEIDEMILSGASLAQVRTEARRHGFVPLAEDGIGKVLGGQITLESLMRSVDVTSRL
jgi:general secretion pathway protein E/type IV pilus assembly protein PilB